MSESVILPLPDGANYLIPDVDDENWGQNVTDFLMAIPLAVPPRSGTFSLTGDLGFGNSYGLKGLYFKSLTANVSTAGVVRLAKTDAIGWRNNVNGANVLLAIDGSDRLTVGGKLISTAVTAGYALISDSDGLPAVSTATATELGYVHGVTSAIQNQLNSAVLNPLAGNLAAGSHKITGLANGTTTGDAVGWGQIPFNAAGYIIGTAVQSIQVTDTTATATSSGVYVVTGSTVTITPKATTHKIKISVSGGLSSSSVSGSNAYMTICKGGVNLVGANGFMEIGGSLTGNLDEYCSVIYEDSPASTSALTYAVYVKGIGGTATWNRATGTTVILVEEIAA